MSKKILCLILFFVLITALSSTCYAENNVVESPKTKVFFDCKQVKLANNPIKINNGILVEANELLAKLGVVLDNKHIFFDKKKNSLTIISKNTKVVMSLNSKRATINKDVIVMNSAPLKYKNKIYIPLQSTVKMFNQQIAYDDISNSIFIRNKIDYDKVKSLIENSISTFNESGKLHISCNIDSKYNNVNTRTFYNSKIDIPSKLMSFDYDENGVGKNTNFIMNNCMFSNDLASDKWTKKYLTQKEYNNQINFFMYNKYLTDKLYCALSVEEKPKSDLIKLSGNVYVPSDGENIALANPEKSKMIIYIREGSLVQINKSYDEYRLEGAEKKLYTTTQIFSYDSNETYIKLPKESQMDFDKSTAAVEKDEGIRQFDIGNYELAISYYDKAIKIDPEYELAYNNKGNALQQLGKYKEAIENFDKAISINPNLSFVYFNKGLTLEAWGKLNDAATNYLKAIDMEQDNYLYTSKAVDALGFTKRYDEALKCCDRFIEVSPDNIEIYLKKADVLLFIEKYKEAILEYDKALKLNPNSYKIYISKGDTYKYLNEYNKAIECYDLAIKSNPDSAEAYYSKAIVLVKLNKLDDAIKCIKVTFKIDPEYKKYFDGSEIFDAIRSKVK